MSRVAYFASKDEFIKDVILNRFIGKMREGARLNHIGGSESEIRSWQNNAPNIRNILELSGVPNDIIVSFEYKVPNGGRIDCMLYGRGKNHKSNVIHIELKQWSNDSVHEIYANGVFRVDAFTGGAYRAVCHPSQQVANYQQHLLNFVEELNDKDTNLEGVAYCYNYSSADNPHALYADHYKTILEENNLYSGNEIETLAQHINKLLCYGSGLEIFNRITHSRIRPAKTLLDAAANMFKGITEFSLLDDQITAARTIFAEVQKAIQYPKRKTAIIVKGGPGTGKTVIALHVLAEIAQQGNALNMFYTTRSKALRESLKVQLKDISYRNGRKNNASDLIANIFQFKPYHYKENEIDLLLIDEAHRIQKGANYMADSFEEETYLSQVQSLLYCSKVCVFFIDDNQAIKTEEIGNSRYIEETALNYHKTILNYKDSPFYQDLQKKRNSLEKNLKKREILIKANDIVNDAEICRLDEKIAELKRHLSKETCLHNVESHIDKDVKIIEMELKSQFRCNGSDNYLDWLDEVLYLPGKEITTTFNEEEYTFKVFDTPADLYNAVLSYDNGKDVSRIAAGYCWRWSKYPGENGDLIKDVKIGNFEMPWETNLSPARGRFENLYASSADTWAIEKEGINQVGCIFSIQGFEIDYIGVILGPDIKYDEENDRLIGVPGKNIAVSSPDPEIYTKHIRNAYRVLMSRGKKGCMIYCTDPNVSAFIRKSLKQHRSEIKI